MFLACLFVCLIVGLRVFTCVFCCRLGLFDRVVLVCLFACLFVWFAWLVGCRVVCLVGCVGLCCVWSLCFELSYLVV